jgi:hypothetical protein
MRASAIVSLGLLAALALAATPVLAMPRPAKPAAGPHVLATVNGQRVYYRHHYRSGRGYGYARGFHANGYALMYAVHDFPRGISATFGYPRCFCGYYGR